ncbi:hypothetical protein [Achromobacter sp. Bel]|nr:hypothetical protein [Achromobacter sp. Bel]NMK46425.1 hypothetical protein [Achromobacter sp. Bel]
MSFKQAAHKTGAAIQPVEGPAFHAWLKNEIDVWHGVIARSGISLN